jgi:hypothetical protein
VFSKKQLDSLFTVSTAISTGTPPSRVQIKSKPNDKNKGQQYHTSLALFLFFHSQAVLNDAKRDTATGGNSIS